MSVDNLMYVKVRRVHLSPVAGANIVQEDLKSELAQLEQEDLNERLASADHVPVHTPAGARMEPKSTFSRPTRVR